MSHMMITGPMQRGYETVLTREALDFVAALHANFFARRREILAARDVRRAAIDHGRLPDFKDETREIREDPSWQVAGHRGAPGLEDRRVEITGPVSAPMAINALNSDAKVWLADLEDATSPTWDNIVTGIGNLSQAVRGTLEFTDEAKGKHYEVTNPTPPTMVVRPRGWHLPEKHLRYVDDHGTDTSASASLVDFGLFFFHNAQALIDAGRGPYFYLAKLEAAREAKLWDDVFSFAEDYLGLSHGTIRATVLIETITAAFQMEEILYELRDHCAGLNAGRWDYIFSMIKNFRSHREFVLPDRSQVSMTVPFMRAYTEHLVKVCHKRGAHAIGGMSAFIPNRRQPEVTENAFAQVKADKDREAGDGFDGSWVAHPDLIPIARESFDAVLGDKPNQLDRQRDDVETTAADLLSMEGLDAQPTEAGVRANIRVGLGYLNAWLSGTGAAALNNLMEDAATAEISRSQIWQWIHHGVILEDGRPVTRRLVERIMAEELATIRRHPADHYCDAVQILRETALDDDLPDFLTTPAYKQFLVHRHAREYGALAA
ncbi:malate synthase A [Brevibacterium luteolum]|uniref:malate synthase A n=1 Tax=Brevibacterium luteolum TaxID=199591 RepID=UPI0021B00B9C|nr:malate synthase A [Brevibacterium luteolum]MCT1921883.1 malate synthase A [Brevibacterium luteolum]